jgi:hypothetical protein
MKNAEDRQEAAGQCKDSSNTFRPSPSCRYVQQGQGGRQSQAAVRSCHLICLPTAVYVINVTTVITRNHILLRGATCERERSTPSPVLATFACMEE